MLKRIVDIFCSLVLLSLVWPLLACLAVIVRLDSPGPALFRQQRMGRHFRRFQLLKLRTMTHRGFGPAYTLGRDPRITRCGRWLRRLKLDELPQLWNVLRGDMSLVGPRPVVPELAMEFRPAYARLLRVRPGLTDPASLKYYNEEEMMAGVDQPMRYFKAVVTPDKIRISERYLQSANIFTDLAIALRTFFTLLSLRRSAAPPPLPEPIPIRLQAHAHQPPGVLAFPHGRRPARRFLEPALHRPLVPAAIAAEPVRPRVRSSGSVPI